MFKPHHTLSSLRSKSTKHNNSPQTTSASSPTAQASPLLPPSILPLSPCFSIFSVDESLKNKIFVESEWCFFPYSWGALSDIIVNLLLIFDVNFWFFRLFRIHPSKPRFGTKRYKTSGRPYFRVKTEIWR